MTLLAFLIKLHENLRKFDSKTNSYIKNSNEKNIHDVRTSIRRFNAAFLILPKRYRKGCLLSDYNQLANKFFRVNSEIRDMDIIQEKLNGYPQTDQRNIVIDVLKKNRQSNLEGAKSIALAIKNMNSNKILDKMDITEKELHKRYNKLFVELVSKIESNFLIVITNTLKIEELHELRKDCKKLKYILELLIKDNNNKNNIAMGVIKTLQNIQDILGSIRDYDITIDYLKKLEPSKEIQEIVNNEIEQRRLKYEEFLRFCKRRLHISRDSFFARIKSLLSS
ncbi:MAG TPA: CHAD domain-containing protein [Nitrososphaeraceae archaeon]|nr:CHAD domain-containing protein [Nitrososphaeraceae archaeon]